MNTIRESIGALRTALHLFSINCPLFAKACLLTNRPEPLAPLFPEFVAAVELAKTDRAKAVEFIKDTLRQWEEA